MAGAVVCRAHALVLALALVVLLPSAGSLPAAPRAGLRGRRLAADLPARAAPAPDIGRFARAGCDNFTNHQWQPLRPGYHITVPYGWLNDPHGMFQLNGTVHLFFQYNPRALAWDAPLWGHVVSRDLAHWTWLPPALLPDSDYDFNGVWSGAATVGDNKLPVLTYTAASTFAPEMGNFFQRQAMATPADLRDPQLKRWVKSKDNPFLVQVPPGGTSFQFRDPTEARHAVWLALTNKANPKPLPRSHYALAVGVQAYCMGGAGIYTAPSMSGPWSYAGSLYNQLVPEPQVDGQCMASRIGGPGSWPGPAYGGPCDQFGVNCRMWEVVDFAELDSGVWMLKWDDQSRFRGLFSMEWYVLGNGPWDYGAVHPGLPRPPGPTKPGRFGAGYSGYPNATHPPGEPGGGRSGGGGGGGGPAGPGSRGQDGGYNRVETMELSATRSLFGGAIDGQVFAPMRTDYGSVYASMVFRTDGGRQVMFGWIYETAAGCTDMCSGELPAAIRRAGFKGVQTLPRQLSYERSTKTLRAYPVPETQKLRGKQVYGGSNAPLAALPRTTPLLAVGTVPRGAAPRTNARQLEVQANFTLLPPAGGGGGGGDDGAGGRPAGATDGRKRSGGSGAGLLAAANEFAAGVRIELGGGRHVDVRLQGTVAPAGQQAWGVSSLSVWVDRSAAGGDTNTTFTEGGPVPLPVEPGAAWALPDTPLSLSVWVDHSVLEVYAMGGLARVTSRIYPDTDDAAWGVSAWALAPEPAAAARRGGGGGGGAGGGSVSDERGAAGAARQAVAPPSVLTGAYCWWCRLWAPRCKDARCYSAFQAWPRAGEWDALLDARVWEVNNAWLAPDC